MTGFDVVQYYRRRRRRRDIPVLRESRFFGTAVAWREGSTKTRGGGGVITRIVVVYSKKKGVNILLERREKRTQNG